MNRPNDLLSSAARLVLGLSLASAAFSQVTQTQDAEPDIPRLQSMAGAGDPSAQLALGLAYQNGRGVQQSDAIAVEWYRKAAAVGNSAAQNDLGVMYRNGWGVEKNKEEAVRWYHLSAKQNNAHAMFNLGTAYYNGDGVGIDDARAYAWFLLAQDNGSESAIDAVGRAEHELGTVILNSGIDDLAEMYFDGDEINRNYNQGLRWLRKAAGNGDLHSQLVLANILTGGIGLPPDYVEARQWCEAALKQRSAKAALCLGNLYRNGLGTPKDPTRALTLLRQAADAGIVEAMEQAADMLASGEAGKVERQASLVYLIGAILKGDKPAQPKAAELRSLMSNKEWKKTREEVQQRFRFLRDAGNLETVLQSLQANSSLRP
jgi:TPR repeat protein